MDDDQRWLIALRCDTGMRLSEASGLLIDDIKLDTKIPFIDLKPHLWRGLKTASSTRQIPLLGASLCAAKNLITKSTNEFAFPRYCTAKNVKANSASGALNKWLKERVLKGNVIHSFRHSFRDRLRAVGCPYDVVSLIVSVGNSARRFCQPSYFIPFFCSFQARRYQPGAADGQDI
jgi:integrase